MQADVEDERRVVDQDVLRDEVAGFWDGQVIDLVLASWSYGDDLVPIDLVTRELRKPAIAKHVGIVCQATGWQTTRYVRIEAPLTGTFLACTNGEFGDRPAPPVDLDA